MTAKVTQCVNGDGNPVAPPSTVLCRQCLDKIGDTLRRLVAEQVTGVRDAALDEPKP